MKPSNPLDPSLIRRAHDQFLSSGNAPRGLVPDYIQNSWARSHGAGVDADRVRELGRLTPGQLREAEERLHSLVEEASPVMDRLHREICGTGSVVLLCGPDGLILRSVGDPEFLQRADRVALAPGVRWGEQEKGTNAIGTAIVEQKPVIVYAAQHYVQTHHFLTCSAAPILDALGKVTGVLDITGDYRSHQTHTMALVKMSAQVIERQLFRRHFRDQVVLRFHSQLPYLGSIYDAQVAFSEDGRQLSANGIARELLEPLAGVGRDFDSLFGLRLTDALPTLRDGDSGMGEFTLPDGTRVFAQIDVAPAVRRVGRSTSVLRSGPTTWPTPTVRSAQPSGSDALARLDTGDAAVSAMLVKARRVVGRDIPILIEGETGTGKEWLARALHESGPRSSAEFVAINCAALPEGLIESELFGYGAGAFTGAQRKGAIGKIQQADGGTLFLDEIGDMPLAMQTRLLRVLQDREVTPLGAGRPQRVDVAVICATHRNLRVLVAEGRFREDLYYRLVGITLSLPPLRCRSDRPVLVQRILAQLLADTDDAVPLPMIDAAAWRRLDAHPWPGNLRELHSVMRTALVLIDDDRVVRVEHLPAEIAGVTDAVDASAPAPARSSVSGIAAISVGAPGVSLAELERRHVVDTFAAHGGNVSATARALGVSRNTLYRKLRDAGADVHPAGFDEAASP